MFVPVVKELVSSKLFTDKITVSKYNRPRVEFDWLSEYQKIHRVTGEVSAWNWTDAYRRARSFTASLSRCLRTLRELSEKNVFSYFLTVTLNGNYVDRKSAICAHKAFKNIMKRLKYVYGGVSYVTVAEYHKDCAIHYHLMINFTNKPKLRYFGKSHKGENLYYILDEFKKSDCFLTVEKLRGNNLSYLTKYITKGANYPLTRKFSTTRDLVRSRLVDKIPFTEDFQTLSRFAEQQGFSLIYKRGNTATYRYTSTHGERERAAVDLFNIDIKDENLSEFYYRFIAEYAENKENIHKRCQAKLERRIK